MIQLNLVLTACAKLTPFWKGSGKWIGSIRPPKTYRWQEVLISKSLGAPWDQEKAANDGPIQI